MLTFVQRVMCPGSEDEDYIETRIRVYDTIRYDTIKEFNVDSKSECDHLNDK